MSVDPGIELRVRVRVGVRVRVRVRVKKLREFDDVRFRVVVRYLCEMVSMRFVRVRHRVKLGDVLLDFTLHFP